MKKYTAEVTEEEIACVIVVAKLILRLLIEYYSNKSLLSKINPLKKALEALRKK